MVKLKGLKRFVRCSLTALSTSLLVTPASVAFEVMVPTDQFYGLDAPNTFDPSVCSKNVPFTIGGANCFFATQFTPENTDMTKFAAVRYSFPATISETQQDTYGDEVGWFSLQVFSEEKTTLDFCALSITYNYATNKVSVIRSLYDASKNCTTEAGGTNVQYVLTDQLTPALADTGNAAEHVRITAYVASEIMWIEVTDRTNPLATPVYSAPVFLGLGDLFSTDNSVKNVYVLATSAEAPGEGEGQPLMLSGTESDFAMRTFSQTDLRDSLISQYAQTPDAPLLEFPNAFGGVVGAIAN